MFVVNKGDLLMGFLFLFILGGFIYKGIATVGQQKNSMFARRIKPKTNIIK